jgi:hypothetical protein
MAYHTDYWLAVAAAAPVIALAAIVSAKETSSLVTELESRGRFDVRLHQLIRRANSLYYLAFGLQIGFLIAALLSLYQERDFQPPFYSLAGVVVGFVLLAAGNALISFRHIDTTSSR